MLMIFQSNIDYKQRFLYNGNELRIWKTTSEVCHNMEQKENPKCVLTSVIENELDILKRHMDILKILQGQQPLGIIKLSELTGYPQHMVRYSLRILEQEGLIEPSSRGAKLTYDVNKVIVDLKDALAHIASVAKDLNRTV